MKSFCSSEKQERTKAVSTNCAHKYCETCRKIIWKENIKALALRFEHSYVADEKRIKVKKKICGKNFDILFNLFN